jgi:8-oxo-dGTP pyrophosphatase MutT (NUDIX family)
MSKIKAAGIFLVNMNREILVGHPTGHHPDFFSIPKGKVEEGETTLEAAIRETYEETNVKLYRDLHGFIDLGTQVYNHKKKEIRLYAHLENRISRWDQFDIRCNSNVPEERGGFPEFDSFMWMSFDEAKTKLHNTQVRGLIELEKRLS